MTDYKSLGFNPYQILKALEISLKCANDIANNVPDARNGFTVSADMTTTPETGYAVAYKATQNSFGLNGLLYALLHVNEFNSHFGGWLNKENGQFYFDAVKVFPAGKIEDAMRFAKEQNQIVIFDLDENIKIKVI